jgi:hypothetical protein
MSFIDKVQSVVNLPVVLQVGGVVVFGLTIWKGVHGFGPSFGLIAGAGMAYVGKHFGRIYNS